MGSTHSYRTTNEIYEQGSLRLANTDEFIFESFDPLFILQEERQAQDPLENAIESEEIDLTPEEDSNLVASTRYFVFEKICHRETVFVVALFKAFSWISQRHSKQASILCL